MAFWFRQTLAAASFFMIAGSMTSAQAEMEIKPTHPNGEVSLVVDFEVKAGYEPEFETLFKRSIKCSRLEPGNVTFDLHKVVGAEGRYVLYEIWRSPEALKSHFERPYTKALFVLFEKALLKPFTAGGLRFIGDLAPAKRLALLTGDPADNPECR
ncbi:MAG: antibiotic biosynthesis monooxygenase [Chitinophagales bacterium]|nr:antibiotic biosynthesis monooxygenase [Hyphomicrobiales bacterium]